MECRAEEVADIVNVVTTAGGLEHVHDLPVFTPKAPQEDQIVKQEIIRIGRDAAVRLMTIGLDVLGRHEIHLRPGAMMNHGLKPSDLIAYVQLHGTDYIVRVAERGVKRTENGHGL